VPIRRTERAGKRLNLLEQCGKCPLALIHRYHYRYGVQPGEWRWVGDIRHARGV